MGHVWKCTINDKDLMGCTGDNGTMKASLEKFHRELPWDLPCKMGRYTRRFNHYDGCDKLQLAITSRDIPTYPSISQQKNIPVTFPFYHHFSGGQGKSLSGPIPKKIPNVFSGFRFSFSRPWRACRCGCQKELCKKDLCWLIFFYHQHYRYNKGC